MARSISLPFIFAAGAWLAIACDDSLDENPDATARDGGSRDAAMPRDTGARDATTDVDLGRADAAPSDADAGSADASPDLDLGLVDGSIVGRYSHEATLLEDGRVLITGGYAEDTLDTAVIYEPGPARFVRASGPMTSPRYRHRATRLPDGRVLLTGGRALTTDALNTAEVFDPATGLFTATATFAIPRDDHSVALLPSGEVLLAAGFNRTSGSLDNAEIYSSALDGARRISNLRAEGGARAIVELLDGRFLIAGGHRGAEVREAEIFDPADESFTATGNMVRGVLRTAHVRLADGRVFFAGGSTVNVLNDLGQIYDPASGLFATTTGTMSVASQSRTGNLLPDGRVLVAGGFDADGSILGAEIFDPNTELFGPAGPGFRPRSNHSATTLADGRVLIVGGTDSQGRLDSAQIYDPTSNTFEDTEPLPPN